MKYPKIALRGSPTTIQQLESLGGFNSRECRGENKAYLYWIDDYGYIKMSFTCEKPPPNGYKLISHISELKSNKLFKLL